jgi:hypothetical protein
LQLTKPLASEDRLWTAVRDSAEGDRLRYGIIHVVDPPVRHRSVQLGRRVEFIAHMQGQAHRTDLERNQLRLDLDWIGAQQSLIPPPGLIEVLDEAEDIRHGV